MPLSSALGTVTSVGLLDRLDALDRRVGFDTPSRGPWRERRPPYPVMVAGVLILFELQGLIQLAMDGTTGLVVLAYLPLFCPAFVVTLVLLYNQRPWGRWLLIASQAPLVAFVTYRLITGSGHVAGLVYVAAIVGLLTLPPSSRRFYRGEWYRRS